MNATSTYRVEVSPMLLVCSHQSGRMQRLHVAACREGLASRRAAELELGGPCFLDGIVPGERQLTLVWRLRPPHARLSSSGET